MQKIDAVTIYHPAFSIKFIRIGTSFGWVATYENSALMPEMKQQPSGTWSDTDVENALIAMCWEAAKEISPVINQTETALYKYLKQELDTVFAEAK